MSQAAANELEIWFTGLPELVQTILHEPFTWMNESLKQVSGDPEALLAAAPRYVQLATTVTSIADAQMRERDVLAGVWSGEAFVAFDTDLGIVDAQLRALANLLTQVPDLLQSAATACVESANVIIDLITSLVMFVVGLVITNLALAIVTAGASIAATTAAGLAKAAQFTSRVTRVITKLSQLLSKIAQQLQKLDVRLKKLAEQMQKLQDFLTDMKKDAKNFSGMEKLRRKGDFYTVNGLVTTGVKIGTLGVVAPPTTGSAAQDAGKNYYDAARAAESAEDVADRELGR
jgi:WXG100 family type VII secretion target